MPKTLLQIYFRTCLHRYVYCTVLSAMCAYYVIVLFMSTNPFFHGWQLVSFDKSRSKIRVSYLWAILTVIPSCVSASIVEFDSIASFWSNLTWLKTGVRTVTSPHLYTSCLQIVSTFHATTKTCMVQYGMYINGLPVSSFSPRASRSMSLKVVVLLPFLFFLLLWHFVKTRKSNS